MKSQKRGFKLDVVFFRAKFKSFRKKLGVLKLRMCSRLFEFVILIAEKLYTWFAFFNSSSSALLKK